MWQAIRKHPRAVLGAILAHLLFVAILVVSFRFSETSIEFGEPQEIIEAVAVDEKVIQAELDKIKAAEQRKKDDARKAREARLKEQRRKEELKKQQAAAAKKLKEQKAAEKKRLAELEKKKKEKLAAEKKRQEADRKRKEEEARLAKLEQERKAKEKQEALQAEIARQEAELQKQLEAEQQARQAEARRQANLSEINKYRSLIKEEVTRHWNIPATAHDDLICEVKVRLIPSGDVVDVQVVKSSGDPAFDNSVEKAVYRAAPLSVPPVESGLFEEFREVVFQFEPRNRV
ncbi:MAG: cell envelope integrity protein TolA [Gammaproteobacteria bacterium]|nr:cell envelope integrity protein TolA [Gammaproteobacteria bacterium]